MEISMVAPEWVFWVFVSYAALYSFNVVHGVIKLFQSRTLNSIERAAVDLVQSRNNLDREFKRRE